MIRLICLFLLLLLSVWVGVQLSHDPGYVLVTINHWTIESTLIIGLILLLLVFIVFHSLLLIMEKLVHYPVQVQHWQAKRRAQRAQATTRQGLIEFSEGYWSAAKNHLIKALPDADTPLLNYLTAARAAQELGENKLRDTYLREAQQSMPEAKIAVELTQAQLQLANQQWEQALATLRHLQDLAPRHPYVLKLLMHLYQEIKDWEQLIALLPELKKNRILSGEAFEQARRHAYLQTMADLSKFTPEVVAQKMANLPASLKDDAELTENYCHFLISQGQHELAESCLKRCLRKQFTEKLISLYGLVNSNEQQLAFAETLLKKQADSPALMLCLGRLSKYRQLWGKAKNYLEKSIALKADPEAYIELGELLMQLGDATEACQAYKKGLETCQKKSIAVLS